jgi:Transposase DDE domain
MQTASLHDGRWSSIISRLSRVADLAATARQFGAFQRARKVRNVEDLLRLIFLYGPAHLSLRSTAAAADDAGMACLSDKGVLGRLRKSADWLEHLLTCLLRDKQGLTAGATEGALDLALVDGSVICTLGSTGTDWRLHARFDPGRGGFADLVLSQGTVGERVDRTEITAGQTVIQDRGYARVRDFAAVLAAKADFITRIGWRSLRLLDVEREALDVMALLPADDQPAEHLVWVKGLTTPLRLIIQRIPLDKAERQQKRVARKASKAGHKMDPRTPLAAGYLMLVTSLPTAAQPAERVLSMYRHRWQIELGFKRLKSIGGIDALPAFDPELARTWLLAHLIAAVLTDEIAIEIVGFPPSAS